MIDAASFFYISQQAFIHYVDKRRFRIDALKDILNDINNYRAVVDEGDTLGHRIAPFS